MANPAAHRRRQVARRRVRKKVPRPFARIGGYDFKEARLLAGFTRSDAAEALFVSERTVRNWEAGRAAVPYSAFKLIKVLGRYDLPGAAWDGWRLNGDTLWSPERKPFRPHELAWWGLTCAMARSWLQRYHEPARFQIELTHDDLGVPRKALPAKQSRAGQGAIGGGVSTPVHPGGERQDSPVALWMRDQSELEGDAIEDLAQVAPRAGRALGGPRRGGTGARGARP
jgi:DNA-binding transcriptional regulator YiaG